MKRKDFLKGLGAIGISVPIAGIAGSKLLTNPGDEPSVRELTITRYTHD